VETEVQVMPPAAARGFLAVANRVSRCERARPVLASLRLPTRSGLGSSAYAAASVPAIAPGTLHLASSWSPARRVQGQRNCSTSSESTDHRGKKSKARPTAAPISEVNLSKMKRARQSSVNTGRGHLAHGQLTEEGLNERLKLNKLRMEKKIKKNPAKREEIELMFAFHGFQLADNSKDFVPWFAENFDFVVKSNLLPASLRLLVLEGEVDLAERGKEAAVANGFKLTEPVMHNMALLYAESKNLDKALNVLNEMREAGFSPRRRTFRLLLELIAPYAGSRERLRQLRTLYLDTKNTLISMQPAMYPDEESYEAALLGFYNGGKALLESNEKEGALVALAMFDECLADLSEDILLPDKRIVELVRDRFQLQPKKYEVSENCTVDPATSQCSCCSKPLKSIEPSKSEHQILLDQAERLSKKAAGSATGKQAWIELRKWLTGLERSNRPVDMIVDAANVAHYRRPDFSLRNLGCVLAHLEDKDINWIMFLHQSHTRGRDVRHAADKERLDKWIAERKVFIVPHGSNDDWYWLYTAVRLGGRTLVLTNDLMRDHHFEMLQQRSFNRWQDRHQANFSFETTPAGDVLPFSIRVEEPSPFSQRVQSNGGSWHIPARPKNAIITEKGPTGDEYAGKINIALEAPADVKLEWLCVKHIE